MPLSLIFFRPVNVEGHVNMEMHIFTSFNPNNGKQPPPIDFYESFVNQPKKNLPKFPTELIKSYKYEAGHSVSHV